MSHILLVEDDSSIASGLQRLLEAQDYQVTLATSQRAALEQIGKSHFDLLIIDIALPDGNGFAVSTMARQIGNCAVIFLTATDDEASVVTGFDLGADDYIVKPFRPLELLSRIKGVLRRADRQASLFIVGNLTIDTVRATVHKGDEEVFLSALEYRILLVFVNNLNIVLTRERLLEEIWSIAGEYVTDNTVTVYIKRLREKIEDNAQSPTIIKTVRGLGYRMEA